MPPTIRCNAAYIYRQLRGIPHTTGESYCCRISAECHRAMTTLEAWSSIRILEFGATLAHLKSDEDPEPILRYVVDPIGPDLRKPRVESVPCHCHAIAMHPNAEAITRKLGSPITRTLASWRECAPGVRFYMIMNRVH